MFEVDGVEWSVFDVTPSRARALAPALQEGWLCFENATERRRLPPIPPNWQQFTSERLTELLAVAETTRLNWRAFVE